MLVGVLSVAFARLLPSVTASPMQVATGVALVVLLNSLWLQHRTRRRRPLVASIGLSWLPLGALNLVLVLSLQRLLPPSPLRHATAAPVLFVLLLSLVVTLYDHWYPVLEHRFAPRTARSNPGTSDSSPGHPLP
ncbi:MAG: hypothetical protein MUC69_06295 [Gemmatimonadales bacterium]|jgi:hypothetical protein|nr:hypothetical protein [Gemmatimonadales bacterium]